MSTGQILQIVGTAVSLAGYPYIGIPISMAGSYIAATDVEYDVPKVNDLKAPQIQYGAKLHRLYGSNRTSAALGWYSPKRVIAGDSGGKGEPDAPTADTADIDVLYILAVDSPSITGIARVFKNGELIWSQHTDSDDDSIAASAQTPAWEDIFFLDGNPAQLPHPVIEAIEGVGNAPAYRHRPSVLIQGLHLGQSGQMPLIEFECIEATVVDSGVIENFDDGLANYSIGGGEEVFTIVSSDYGNALQGIGGVVTGVSSSISRPISVTGFTKLTFKVRLDDLTVGTIPDDAPRFVLKDGISTFFEFVPAREKTFDTEQRPFVQLNGALVAVAPQLSVGLWYDCILTQESSSLCTFELRQDGNLIRATDFNGTFSPWNADTIHFNDELSQAGGSNTKPTASYDEIVIGAARVAPNMADLADIVSAEWARVEDVAYIDVTDLEGIPVRGFQSSGSVRGAYEALAPVFHFGAVCSDKLYFRLQGAASVATITYGQLAAGEDKAADEPFAPVRANDEEVLERAMLTYPNYVDDYANGTETGNRGIGSSTIVAAMQTNVVMIPSEAKAVAETFAAMAGIAATTGQITLTDYYAALEPTDAIIVPDEDGNLHRMRMQRLTSGRGVRALDLVRDDVTALIAPGITTGGYTQSLTITLPAETEIVLLDIPILRDVDNDPGFYAVAKGAPRGSTLYSSLDGVTYAPEVAFTQQSVFGPCTTILGNWTGGRVFDEVNSVTVNVGAGTLSSSTRAALLADQAINACAIGIDGRCELCQFRTAALVSAGYYTLTGFLRGSRGTEWASTGHGGGETFALLTGAGRRVEIQVGELGVMQYFKGVSSGRLLSSAPYHILSADGVGLKPFSPVNVRVSRATNNDATITFDRRTRMSTRFASSMGIFCPLGEASESYEIDIYSSNAYTTVVRTLTALTPSVAYTAAQQTSDGITPGATMYMRVFQISATVARGYPAEAAA